MRAGRGGVRSPFDIHPAPRGLEVFDVSGRDRADDRLSEKQLRIAEGRTNPQTGVPAFTVVFAFGPAKKLRCRFTERDPREPDRFAFPSRTN